MAVKDFIGINHGKRPIILDLPNDTYVQQLKPVEIHLKEDGSITNGPSFCIVLKASGMLDTKMACVGQITLEMLNEGLKDIGYEIKKV
jgi:hypothetical protein